jgi:acyl carrier protein
VNDIAAIVQRCYRELLGPARRDRALDLRRRLFEDDGLSSLQLVTLVTTVCDEAGLPLTTLTEQDIARMKTPGDIIAIVQTALQKAATHDLE